MRRLALLVALAMAIVPAAAFAAERQTSVVDVEDEVMCPICGTLLQLSESPQAQRQRAFVGGLVAAGKTKAEIKDALVAEYGRAVLALPGGSGFDLSAYLVPAIAFAIAAAALAVGIGRWRRAGGPPTQGPGRSSGPRGEDAERLDEDLARYDL
ncbi:MAG TPA: cytochrome c-type biogenesis protein CcmH [Solirubrobacterales bacterium]|nr:cytochrome c-type biogenesis protein CcmH [Solirubrobacterales bacterium]